MIDTRVYRDQHDALLHLAVILDQRAREAIDTAGAERALAVLGEFATALVEHLRMEDDHLYPSLVAHEDAAISALAHGYFAEMGGIRGLFGVYVERWTVPAILADHARFVRETELLLQGLADRIQRENDTLYPVAEASAVRAA